MTKKRSFLKKRKNLGEEADFTPLSVRVCEKDIPRHSHSTLLRPGVRGLNDKEIGVRSTPYLLNVNCGFRIADFRLRIALG